MSNFFYFIFLACFPLSLLYAEKPTVIVSVAPDCFFVEKIGGETIQVLLMVPAGASAHTFEPSPRQMVQVGKASLWFTIGESFEERAIQAIRSHHPALKVVSLQRGIDLINTEGSKLRCHCCPGSYDLHFWLSPRLAQLQAKTIADTLSEMYPEQQLVYQKNLEAFNHELKQLDDQIRSILAPLKQRDVLVGHPAYAYFCREYGLNQYSIEMEGRDPTPRQMTQLLGEIRTLGLKTIFVQPQYSNKAAQLVANQIGGIIVTLDPYSQDYINSMLQIAHAFAEQ